MWRFEVALVAVTASLTIGVSAIRAQAVEKKEDSVFFDEGDGDFDPVPSASQTKPVSRPAESTDAAVGSSPEAGAGGESAPDEKNHERPAHNPKIGKKSKKTLKQEPAHGADTEIGEPSANFETGNKNASNAGGQAAKKAKAGKGDAGIFVTTKAVCPIRREPASESQPISKTRATRKIWVQKVDEQWVRAFVKSGEAGYISTDCLE